MGIIHQIVERVKKKMDMFRLDTFCFQIFCSAEDVEMMKMEGKTKSSAFHYNKNYLKFGNFLRLNEQRGKKNQHINPTNSIGSNKILSSDIILSSV